ncbi:MAG: hypothetical protein NC299_11065 [Lachnospiraceae bacterium]|nr:hypothetical protein [Ruminococcus sp.]MCM1275887.1 hypothetical protein [Lachnospiraceae bacterium]
MANGDVNYLAKKYCALCFEPLDDDFSGTCSACGRKTTALNLLKRLKFDETVDKKSRSTPRFAALLSAIAFAVQLAYGVVLLLSALNVSPSTGSTSVSSEPFVLEELTEEEQREREIYHYYFEKALKCDDYQEFLEECKPLKYDVSYYTGIWNNAGISRYIEESQSQIPTDPLPAAKKDKKDTRALKAVEFIISVIFIVLSVCGLGVCATVFLETDGSVEYLMWCSGSFAEIFVLSLNFFSVVLLFLSVYQLNFFNERLGGGRLRYSRLWKIHKAKNPIGNADEWHCKNCGYINSKLDGECKSCGKYR